MYPQYFILAYIYLIAHLFLEQVHLNFGTDQIPTVNKGVMDLSSFTVEVGVQHNAVWEFLKALTDNTSFDFARNCA